MSIIAKKKVIINYFIANGQLISEDLIMLLESEKNLDIIHEQAKKRADMKHIQKTIESLMKNYGSENNSNQTPEVNIDKKSEVNLNQTFAVDIGEGSKSNLRGTFTGDKFISKKQHITVNDYDLVPKKREVDHFVSHFNQRYKKIEFILKQRKELSNIISIARLKTKKDRDNVALIGMVKSKEITKNNNIILTLEDRTGEIKVLVNKTNNEVFKIGAEIVEDEVIGIVGVSGDNIIFSNSIIQPDIPLDKEYKKYHKDEYVVFLSDIHFGSKYFLQEEFDKFILWINQKTGTSKQREIASKVKHIFIIGDLVDGVGIYPNQESELEVLDIYDQYKIAAAQLRKIPSNITIVICPGNHDALRLSEPQPKLSNKYANGLYEMDNVVLVSNPAYISIYADSTFPGFDILMYHGYSFDYYVANVESIRKNGGYDRADNIMKFLLKRRHLAPTYTSTLFIPEIDNDPLVIEKIPDFFITGHIHKTAVSIYRNITLICGSCWQSKTSFQEKVGHNPEPAKVPVVNLQTRKVTILNFEK